MPSSIDPLSRSCITPNPRSTAIMGRVRRKGPGGWQVALDRLGDQVSLGDVKSFQWKIMPFPRDFKYFKSEFLFKLDDKSTKPERLGLVNI